MSTQHGDRRHDQHEGERLTAYLLGVLDEQEVSAVEQHLAACPDCRQELAELREMERALGEVPPEALLDGPPDGGDLLLQRTLRQVRRERVGQERRRWVAVGVAAAVAGAALLGGGMLIGRSGTGSGPGVALPTPPSVSGAPSTPAVPPAGTRTASVTDPETGTRMTVAVLPAKGWVRVNAAVVGIPAGEECRLMVIGKDGTKEIAGGWKVSPKGATSGINLDGTALLDPAEVAAVAVENIHGKRFVTAPLPS
ncbi:anti-sigma factor [Peterkaempfera bronchialis]|uniref:Anti-sigma factor n=1 Tax=Peterkaempfera bronchialis TaxID=2126346 RepID=A0A345SUJ7_9ACTN|nr:zf-HC2 domain-containing protein [Peterkaempfera bronchialis]AXI77402.1 anti-sigma factor [Peterkaempfera bronchialis]